MLCLAKEKDCEDVTSASVTLLRRCPEAALDLWPCSDPNGPRGRNIMHAIAEFGHWGAWIVLSQFITSAYPQRSVGILQKIRRLSVETDK